MERKVWVIEREGLPVACGVGVSHAAAIPGNVVTWYGPGLTEAQLEALRALAALLRVTGDAARKTAYAESTRLGNRAIFAGRSDGFAVAADWLSALVGELAAGEPGSVALAVAEGLQTT